MKHAIALGLLCAGFTLSFTSTFAQVDDDRQFRKHELAVDVAPLLRSNQNFPQVQPLNLMYRFHLSDASALRLRLTGSVNNSKQSFSNESDNQGGGINRNTVTATNNNSNGEVRLGYQYYVPVNKLYFYFGVDGVFQYGKGTSENIQDVRNDFSSQKNTSTGSFTTLGFGGAPVVGFTYAFTKGFSLGIENSFAAVQSKTKSSGESEVLTFDSAGNQINRFSSFNDSEFTNFTVNVVPLQNLLLFMCFHF